MDENNQELANQVDSLRIEHSELCRLLKEKGDAKVDLLASAQRISDQIEQGKKTLAEQAVLIAQNAEAKNAELIALSDKLIAKEALLNEAFNKISSMESFASSTSNILKAKQDELMAKESELSQKEQSLSSKISSLNSRENELNKRSDSLDKANIINAEASQKLYDDERMLSVREDSVNAKEAHIATASESVKAQLELLASKIAEADKKEVELLSAQALLNSSMEQIKADTESNIALKAELADKMKKIDALITTNQSKEIELQVREHDCDVRERDIIYRKKLLES